MTQHRARHVLQGTQARARHVEKTHLQRRTDPISRPESLADGAAIAHIKGKPAPQLKFGQRFGECAPPDVGRSKHLFLLGWLLGFQAVVYTYDAWYTPIYFAEEDQNPTRNLPRSMIATVLSCAAIYLLFNGALIHALGMERLQVATAPAADAARSVFGSYGRQVILVISIVTVTSCMNATLMTAPRVLYDMARDGL
jgi:amino acid transporter